MLTAIRLFSHQTWALNPLLQLFSTCRDLSARLLFSLTTLSPFDTIPLLCNSCKIVSSRILDYNRTLWFCFFFRTRVGFRVRRWWVWRLLLTSYVSLLFLQNNNQIKRCSAWVNVADKIEYSNYTSWTVASTKTERSLLIEQCSFRTTRCSV